MPGMQFIVKILGTLLILCFAATLHAQSVFLPQSSKHSAFLDRLEVLLQRDSLLNVSTSKPLSRRMVAGVGERLWSSPGFASLSKQDRYNLESLLANNIEWLAMDDSVFRSRKPLWNTFYRSKANLFEVNQTDFFLSVNPVLQFSFGKEKNNSELLFLNARGVTVRGLIARRLGFYTYLVENLERAPLYVQDRVTQNRAIPGAGRYNDFKTTGWDFSDARGGITFNAAKYIDIQFAYDRNFIGNGYRSLFLGDFGSNYLFLKVNTRVWKLNYQNLFMELNPQFPRSVRDGDILLDKKYAAMHHLSFNATPWLNIGIFEAVLFGRKNHFDFMYLNPIIFLRTAEKQNNSPDNSFVGLDFKANIRKRAQVYGQLLFDELIVKELRAGNGWWGNKFAVQAGAKYMNAFGISNLDLQGEINLVRPYTYSFEDSVSNYSHYNEVMAHPLGANFVEGVAIVRYQPLPRLTTQARLILFKQGVDTGNANYGSNIFKLYQTRSAGYDVTLPFGPKATGNNFHLLASYEWRENVFFDLSVLLRRWKTESNVAPARNTDLMSIGFRWNMHRRDADF
jgi:hypothetical protein